MTFLGKDGCPCINTTDILASLPERQCSGDAGLRLRIDGSSCVPFSYGSSECLQHDLLDASQCNVDLAGEYILPSYCFRPWCFVDFETCRKDSNVRVFRSSYFPFESDVDLFYSYATCNSTAEDWSDVEDDIIENKEALGGISIAANIPTYQVPMTYKRDADGEILTSVGPEYYDDSIPFEGAYLKYFDEIKRISKGDIRNVTVTHRTKASSRVHPASSYTAAVQDIHDGLVDMAIGPFWITAQRLKLSAFTIPFVLDRTFLVSPAQERHNEFIYNVKKVLRPFSWALWGIILIIIVYASVLSVWFNEVTTTSERNHCRSNNGRRNPHPQGTPRRGRKRAYSRLVLDEFLEKGMFFCSAGVEQDKSSSLPAKLLLFGFGFFILVAVSAYVASLAAFLVMSGISIEVETMQEAVAQRITICAHPALKTEMEIDWPDADFYFHKNANNFHGMLEDYDAGKCRVMAVGYEDTSMDTKFLQGLCERGLVYTKSLIVEVPIAFPIRSTIEAGFSYWIYQGQMRHGVTLQAAKDKFPQEHCNVDYTAEISGDDQDQISETNMSFPIVFFLCCSVMAVILQLCGGNASFVGRRSALLTSLHPTYQVKHMDDNADEEEEKVEEEEKKVDNCDEEEEKISLVTSLHPPDQLDNMDDKADEEEESVDICDEEEIWIFGGKRSERTPLQIRSSPSIIHGRCAEFGHTGSDTIVYA